MNIGLQLRGYLILRRVLQPVMRRVLAGRICKAKENAARAGERLGIATQVRPTGRVVWMHAVGLGEVLALRPLIVGMQQVAPDLNFVITSTARSSADVLGQNLPANTVHQFLPLDGPTYMAKFLDHWQPCLSIWSEQDIWPGAIHDCAARDIPLAYVNGRMDNKSTAKRARLAGLYKKVFGLFDLITVQDEQTAENLSSLGGRDVRVTGSLKPAAEPLSVDVGMLATLQVALEGRKIWVAASTHCEDEAVLIDAQRELVKRDPSWLLILAPRAPARGDEIEGALVQAGLTCTRRSKGGQPDPSHSVWIVDSFGELGLWYRLAAAAFVGGSYGSLGGHNPWEAICLNLLVCHGPNVANFAKDYEVLDYSGASQPLPDDASSVPALVDFVVQSQTTQANVGALVEDAKAALKPLVKDLIVMIRAGA
ncbi:MAG: glycosyltransferase N-terminal domain-containing protein [Ascidiaceihabitans sp.]|jgi:3-deoxy-D-manno-octulosonic-acid transferase|tara:strand:+ start:495 stop:1766 length:1272 start_codon:yes stop_codon:yes gene_type:complete